MNDLTTVFSDAKSRMATWLPQVLEEVLFTTKSTMPSLKVDWDEAAGEGWARIQRGSDSESLGIIRVDLPLAILSEFCPDQLEKIIADKIAVVVRVPDWANPEYRINLATVQAILPDWAWQRFEEPGPNSEQFSINDLWWVTI